MTMVFGRVLSIVSATSNHLISKILWRLTNAFTLLLIVAVVHQIGGELYEGYIKWSDASPERVLNEALTMLQHEPADDVLRWYSKKTKIDLDVAGLDLSQEAMAMADTKINLAGLEILHLVADIEGDYQAHTLANIGFKYLRGEIVSPDKARAVEYLSEAHQLGHARASTILAVLYYKGDGVAKDPQKSLAFFQAAINQDSHDALWRRGTLRVDETSELYALDEGVADLKLAAEMGNADAAETLAILHIDGFIKEEMTDVRDWLQQAIDEGLYSMAEYLGHYQLKGIGGPIALEEAVGTFSDASSFGKNNAATALLGGLYLDGYYVDYHHKIEKNIELAIETLERGSANGCSSCKWMLGDFYLNQNLTDPTAHRKGFNYLQDAAEMGFDKAQAQLARMFMIGDGVEQDFNVAFEMASKAAAQMNADGISAIGTMYYLGWGRRVDEKTAFQYFNAAAELGDVEAKERVGHMLFEGVGVEADKEKALPFIFESASAGNELAMFKAAKIHFFGDGVEQDFAKAAHYYRQLAEAGQAKSQLALATTYLLLAEAQPELVRYAHMWAELAARQDHDAAADWRTEFAGKSEFQDGLELADACWKLEFQGCEPEFNFEKMSMEEIWKGKELAKPSISS